MQNYFSTLLLLLLALNSSAQFKIDRSAIKPVNKNTTVTKQPPVMTPVSSGMKITGTVNLPPVYKFNAQDLGSTVTVSLEPSRGSSGRLFPNVSVRSSTPQTDNSDPAWDCSVYQKSIYATSDNFLNTNYGSRTANIYPGAIYNFSDFMTGNYLPVENGRNPIVLSSTNFANTSGQVIKNINDPKSYNILQAVSDIVRPFSNQVGSGNIEYQVFESSNNASLMISATAGGGYAGFTASGSYQNQNKTGYSYLTIDAVKPMYTIQTNVPVNGYLANTSGLQGSSNLVVIRSVVYGCRVLANVEVKNGSTQTDVKFQTALKLGGVDVNGTFNYLSTTDNASRQVNCLVVGGPSSTTVYSDPKTLKQGIENIFAQTTLNMAQPIAYVVSDINGNILQVVSTTDVFLDRNCRPKNAVYRLTGVSVEVLTGMNDEKNDGSNVEVDLINGNNRNIATTPNQLNLAFPVNSRQKINLQMTTNDLSQTGLSAFANGGYVDIFFTPAQIVFGWDEWQLANVEVFLQFSDETGNMAAGSPYRLTYPVSNIYLKKNEQRLRIPFSLKPGNNGLPALTAGNPFKPGL